MKETRSPICLFVYNKHHIINKVLRSISTCKNFKKHKVFIFSDNCKNENDLKNVNKLRENLSKFERKNKNVTIFFRKKNFGLKKNITQGITQIISKYKKVIVLEDDLLLSNDFFDFMEANLVLYKKNRNILSICGYSPSNLFKKKKNPFDNFFSHTPCSWGWGTWEDRWRLFKDNYNIKDRNLESIKKIFSLSTLENFYSFLDINLKKKDLWAANWTYVCLKNKLFNSYPIISKISNIGFDGTGQRGYSSKYKQKLNKINLRKKIKLKKIVKLDLDCENILISHFNNKNYTIRAAKYYTPDFVKMIYKGVYQKIL